MPKKSTEPFNYDKLIQIYQELGYPPKLIGQWTSPESDFEALRRKVEELKPKKILEVGGFVGLATLAMASSLPKGSAIYSIDPNLPLRDEMSALNSDLFDLDVSIGSQDLAAQVAQKAGLSSKIKFIAGGFSTSSTYTSINTNPERKVQIVGPEVCEKFGPFDFVLIDGLHYTDAVLSDLQLASANLVPGGTIALDNTLDLCWGPHVRRAIFRFLEEQADFVFTQDRSWHPMMNIGYLRHFTPGTKRYSIDSTYDQDFYERCVEMHSKVVPHFAQLINDQHNPKSIIDIGCGEGLWLRAFLDLGVKVLLGVDGSREAILKRNRSLADIVSVHDLREILNHKRRCDLCLCLDVIEHVEPEFEDNVIQTLIGASDTIIFSSPPPGQGGDGHVNERPIAHWVEKFFNHGYLFFDDIRPHFQGMEHIPETTYHLNIFTVRKMFDPKNISSKDFEDILHKVALDKESRIEDLFLQTLFMSREIELLRRGGLGSGSSSSRMRLEMDDELHERLNLVDFEIPVQRMQSGDGQLYIFGFKTHAAEVFARMPWFAQTELLENGIPLSSSTIFHEEILREGKGRYSMWKNGVYFSTSDNTDPRKNGRVYSFKVPAYVKFLEGMPDVTIEKCGF